MSNKIYIKQVNIENFKCFKGNFNLPLNEGLNIIVGDNEAGKSTILEAIHLALTGLLNGRYLKNELTQYLFNHEVVDEYIKKANTGDNPPLPYILIEVIIAGEDLSKFEGDNNFEGKKECGISFKIGFDDKYKPEYEEFIKNGDIKTIPIEYYDIFWTSCARDNITARSIPIKSALIDSSSNHYENGSDIYISRIIKDNLEEKDKVNISQAYRRMVDSFMCDNSVKEISKKIKTDANISTKRVELSVGLSSKNSWESSLMTYFDDIPFHYIGKGEQCIVKTKLALSHKKSQEANILLLEEPENHLSHTKLNQLINEIKESNSEKQIIVSTHSSFVANKLGLGNLILLNNKKTVRLNNLNDDTKIFFEKLSGYDTLRLILCQKAILVEGDSDELIIQKAFLIQNGMLPIECNKGIDVISVGTTFLRFLEIAKEIDKSVVVVTDNDGKPDGVKNKYTDYLGENAKDSIKICFDEDVDTGVLEIDGKAFNYNTLEPKMLKANSLDSLNKIFGTNYQNTDDLHKYMHAKKTECALKIFETKEIVKFPKYIQDAIA
ncbi:MAG: AAA family ATPase [Candidatus Shapirobacteria bacterium]|jgi:putative ATP-dependent endonuclease of OLD family